MPTPYTQQNSAITEIAIEHEQTWNHCNLHIAMVQANKNTNNQKIYIGQFALSNKNLLIEKLNELIHHRQLYSDVFQEIEHEFYQPIYKKLDDQDINILKTIAKKIAAFDQIYNLINICERRDSICIELLYFNKCYQIIMVESLPNDKILIKKPDTFKKFMISYIS